MEIKEVKCIWWDGYHNAFTDIIKFRDNYFVCFRHATEHYSFKGEGEIYVLKSTDLENWRLIKKFPPLKDDRDPKFFIFKEKLGVLFFARTDIDINKKILDAYISYSDDGESFSPVIKISSEDSLFFWRIRNYREKLYATAYKSGEKGDDWGSYLFISDDGESFKEVSPILKGEYANETDLLFDGDICFAVVRRENWQTPSLCISKYPFDKWEHYCLNKVIQAPCLFKFKGEFYIAGRIFKPLSATGILKLDVEEKRVEDEIILPSGGDTSYCGAVVENDKLYLSYYSQHEIEKREGKVGNNAAGIYIAEIGG